MPRVRPTDDPLVRESQLASFAEALEEVFGRLTLIERALGDALESLEEIEDAVFGPTESVEDEGEQPQYTTGESPGVMPGSVDAAGFPHDVLDDIEPADEVPEEGVDEEPDPDPNDDYGDPEEEVDDAEDPPQEALQAELDAEAAARHERNMLRRADRAAEGMIEDGPRAYIGQQPEYGADVMMPDVRAPGADPNTGDPGGLQLRPPTYAQGEEGWDGTP